MAGIDYTIPQQFKGIQIELPENAMARAMQMRQLQESSELNALRRQDAQEAAQLRRQELQFRTQEAKTKEEERKRVLSKEQLVEAVADLTSYDTVASVLAGIKQKVAAGQVTQAQADKVIAGLPKNDFELPAWQIRTMRSLLPAKEQYAELKAARDAAYENYADTEAFAGRQPLLRDAWERPTAPAVAAPSAEAAPAPATTTLTTTPEVTSPQGFGPVVPGMSYDDYRNKSISVNQERVLGKEAYEAEQQRLAQMGQTAPANALAADVAPTNALVNPPAAVKEEMALPSVAVQGKRFGFDYLDPQAQILYERAAKTKDKDKAATYRAIAKEIQDANVAALKERQLTGDFLNVVNAEKQIAELEKQPQTPEIKRLVATLRAQIKGTTQGKGTNVNVGVKLPEGVKAVDQQYAKDYLDWRQGGGTDAAANAGQIKSVLDRFAAGERLSGPSIGLAPDFFNALMNPQALGAKQQIEEVVQRNLRAVLGAQFTQVEGERLISRAFDARLSPQENVKRLRKLFMQIQTAAEQKEAMAQYYEANETLRGFKGKTPSINDFYSVLNAPDMPPKGSVDVKGPDGKVYRFPDRKSADAFKKEHGIKD